MFSKPLFLFLVLKKIAENYRGVVKVGTYNMYNIVSTKHSQTIILKSWMKFVYLPFSAMF